MFIKIMLLMVKHLFYTYLTFCTITDSSIMSPVFTLTKADCVIITG